MRVEDMVEDDVLEEEGVEDLVYEYAVMKRSQPSVEIKQDAKGNVSYTVKAYADTLEAAVTDAVLAFGDVKLRLNEQEEQDAEG